ncbi:MAG: PilZ domain-containing protein [Nitrospira sp.]|nr:PilZ domain-containing protein [Nitrospira sp.]
MTNTGWEWPIRDSQENHSERVALLRPIPYEMTVTMEDVAGATPIGRALSLNISRGGMLVLMDQAPQVDQVLKVYVPTPVTLAETPTLAEVRWTRKLPFGKSNGNGPCFVGLKFMF